MTRVLRFIALTALALAGQAFAGQPLQFNLTDLIKGSAPSGPKPYVTATFQDVSRGVVRLTLSTSGLSASESMKQFLFNYNGALGALKFTRVSGESAQISVGKNKFEDAKDNEYDIRFAFSTKGNMFVGKEKSVYDIKANGLTAQSFAAKSKSDDDDHGKNKHHHRSKDYFAAAEVRLRNGSASWVGAPIAAVPEPEAYAMMLAGLGLVGFAALRRKKQLAI